MGAWGSGTFENDDACDWLGELETGGVDALRDCLSMVAGVYLEAPDASIMLAAAEVVAAACGSPMEGQPPEEVVAFLARRPQIDADLLAAARRAVERILGDQSELRELWEDSDDHDEWQGATLDLGKRLSRCQPT